jgi:decaprenylphospho-beta-D-ribofuranose 2-oxidase
LQAATPDRVCGWGGGERTPVWRWLPHDTAALRAALGTGARGWPGAIARGGGRSYGDAAQCGGGLVISTSRFDELELDLDTAVLTAGGGVTLARILTECVPRGLMLPVVPGTQHVTVGGAIASDVHGKNHGRAGAFGRHVEALGLVTATGDLLELTPTTPGGLFDATVGGMGLTGVIVWARIRLSRVPGPWLSVDTDRAGSLDETLALLAGPGGPHRVAWLDLLGRGSVRGIVTRAEHTPAGDAKQLADARPATRPARAAIPPGWPGWALRPDIVRAYNALRYRRAPRRESGRILGFGEHMFPLDAVASWPRLYGPDGFVQYQFVVPSGAERTLEFVIRRLRKARLPAFLAILKDMGAAGRAPLSFPLAGWTLALDIPRRAPGLMAALDGCDELVAGAGGRVYLTKDARLRPEVTAAMYPRLDEWREIRDGIDPDGIWRSDLALRTGLVA